MVVPEAHPRIDVGGAGHALLQAADRLAHEDRAEAGRHEPGEVGDLDRLLAERVAELEGAGEHGGVGVGGAHDLDETHRGHRVEEVRADHLARATRGGTEHADRQARGVRREHGRVARRRADAGPHGLLDGEVLGHGLDDDLGLGDRGLEVGGHRAGAVPGEVVAAGARPVLVVLDPFAGRRAVLLGRLDDGDGEPGAARVERDAGAHDPAPDDDGAHGPQPSWGRRRRKKVPVAVDTGSPSAFEMVVAR